MNHPKFSEGRMCALGFVICIVALAGCSSGGGGVRGSGTPGTFQAMLNEPAIDQDFGRAPQPAAPSATDAPAPVAPAATSNVVGESCQSSDSSKVCLALKYVVYKDESGTPVVKADQAAEVVRQMNEVWKQCNLGFQIDDFQPINPVESGLVFSTADNSELDDIRSVLVDDRTLLVVTTGPWNRSGGLGGTGANAWTAMPGSTPYGAVLESAVGTFANIIAHELGHYLDLGHVSDTSDLMNPVIYDSSKELTPDQCDTARNAASSYWKSMLR